MPRKKSIENIIIIIITITIITEVNVNAIFDTKMAISGPFYNFCCPVISPLQKEW
jgi:hypothetical protein